MVKAVRYYYRNNRYCIGCYSVVRYRTLVRKLIKGNRMVTILGWIIAIFLIIGLIQWIGENINY